MAAHNKLLRRILRGTSDENIDFNSLCALLKRLGFCKRIKGGHHIFWKEGAPEILKLQPRGNLAKPYQVRQVRNVILKYKLGDHLETKE